MEKENELTRELKELLRAEGADLVGVGDLTEVPENVRHGLSVGISVAVKYPKEIIRGISELPTQEYRNWYGSLNEQLDRIVTAGTSFLEKKGYQAIAKTRQQVGSYDDDCITELPHKTVATRAGLGWIGKCALLVTERYGSMVRISSILTNAPLTAAKPVNQAVEDVQLVKMPVLLMPFMESYGMFLCRVKNSLTSESVSRWQDYVRRKGLGNVKISVESV